MGLRNSSKSVGDSIFSYRQLEGAPPRPRFEILSYHPSAWVSKRSRCQNFCTWLCPKFSPLFLSYSNFFVCTNICYSLPLTYYYLFHITYNCSVIKYRLFWPSVPYSPLWENGKWFKSYHMTHMIQIKRFLNTLAQRSCTAAVFFGVGMRTSIFCPKRDGLKLDLRTILISSFCRLISRTKGITRNGREMS